MQIDPEFQSLIPPLSADEYSQLEENIKAEGCRDPLVVWDDILIDGHNRFKICTNHKVHFDKVCKRFSDRSEVIEWIIRNQFGRRNLDAYQRTKLALRLEETIKDRAKANQSMSEGRGVKGPQISANLNPIETREEIAKLAGVSRDTVDKVKRIESKATPEIKASLASGSISINKAHDTVKMPKAPTWNPDDAERLWMLAKTDLDKILANDLSRERVLQKVVTYAQTRIDNKL